VSNYTKLYFRIFQSFTELIGNYSVTCWLCSTMERCYSI